MATSAIGNWPTLQADVKAPPLADVGPTDSACSAPAACKRVLRETHRVVRPAVTMRSGPVSLCWYARFVAVLSRSAAFFEATWPLRRL